MFGGIEAGGTKFVCAVGNAAGEIKEKTVIPTAAPEQTMPQVIGFFQSIHSKTPLSAIGIATFGPVDLNVGSSYYGYITTSPKPGWGHYNLLGAIRGKFNIPIGFDTDVNGAALGEYRWGAARGLDTFIYVTVGTGIGAGGMVAGKLMHGLIHPEMGHLLIPRDRKQDNFAGICPFHGDCLEGLASGPAILKRWNVKTAADLPENHPAWELEAHYLALAFANCVLVLSPEKIIFGGGVAKNRQLYPKIREKMQKILNGYIKHENIQNKIADFVVEPGLGGQAGICGAIALAGQSYLKSQTSSFSR
ncbi:MAG: ROK family protein [Elusimicrobia bacterium]|nr:ROK family protein [Elusimicrobiota bacterium]